MTAAVTVRHNEPGQRYEVTLDGQTAFSQYEMRGDTILFLHTELPEALEGRGIGSAIAKAALDDAQRRKLSVIPECPFIRGYIDRHPEYRDLVGRGPAEGD